MPSKCRSQKHQLDKNAPNSHRGLNYQPGLEHCADAEAGGGGFKQVALMLVAGQFAPAPAQDFAVQRSAHVTDDIRPHGFFSS